MSNQDYGQQGGDQFGQDPNQQGGQFGQGQYGQDPNQQDNQYGQDPNQQDNQYGQDQSAQQGNQLGTGDYQDQMQKGQLGQGGSQDPYQQQQTPQSGSTPLGGARQQAEQQIDSAIDQYAGRVPGGQKVEQQAKDAAHGALDNIEQQGENRLGNLGGLSGGNP